MERKEAVLTRGGMEVSNQQRIIIDHVAGNRVTVTAAGAGSGKTYTSIAAVMHLIETQGASIDQFVLISFTNKAADSLKGKIQAAIQKRAKEAETAEARFQWRKQQERLAAAYVGTIHGFCRQVLKLFGYLHHIAYDSGISFSKRLRDEVFLEAISAHYQSGAPAAVYGGQSLMTDYELLKLMGNLYDHVRNQGYDFEQIRDWTSRQAEDEGKPYRVAMAQLALEAAESYRRRKKAEQVYDPHDLLQSTAELLNASGAGDTIARQIARRYQYLFVDEFQDTDAIQKDIVETLIPHMKAVLIVGDQKQSIYAFRGTQVQLLHEMSFRHTGAAPLPMNISRRPTDPFRKVVNALFAGIGKREEYAFLREPLDAYDEILQGQGDPPPLLFAGVARSAGKEGRIQRTAAAIGWLLSGSHNHTLEHERGKYAPIAAGDIVILTRTNKVQEEYVAGLQPILSPQGYQVKADAGEAFYALPEIVSAFYMLQLLLSYPNNDAALTLALDTPFLHAHRRPEARDEKIRQVQKPARGNPISEAFAHYNPPLHDRLEQLQKMIRTATVPQLLEQLYRLFAIREYYDARQNEQAVQNLEYLREVGRNLFSEDQALTLHTFVDFLRTSMLTGREEERMAPPKQEAGGAKRDVPPYIRVMTIHRAKGLEFPIVIIPEAQAPLDKSNEEQEPPFLIVDRDARGNRLEHGLEVKIRLQEDEAGNAPDTRSPQYREGIRHDQGKLREEEMRVLYVAVTRAEHSVILVGTQRGRPLDKDSPFYSWQDELLKAKDDLRRLGAIFG